LDPADDSEINCNDASISVSSTNQWQAAVVVACWAGGFQTSSIKAPCWASHLSECRALCSSPKPEPQDCPSNASWFNHVVVHNEVIRTSCPVRQQMQTSYDALSQENSRARFKEWVTNFSKGDTRGRDFLTTKKDK